ncbi:hypothetical protein GCM10018954_069230 [Kutzneria kofuensis]
MVGAVDGSATILTDEAEKAEAVAWLRAKYEQYRERPPTGPVIRVAVYKVVNWHG